MVNDIRETIESADVDRKIKNLFLERIAKGSLLRDENEEDHFCVYFAGCDFTNKEFFLGHHRKSGLWLFNGGHIDKRELPGQSVVREIKEEWGIDFSQKDIGKPKLLTITKIYNPMKQKCRVHYDIWYFISLNKKKFVPDNNLLNKEFFKNKWINIGGAKKLVTEKNTLSAISLFDKF